MSDEILNTPGSDRRMLVFSAHAADFCSRAGGLIALSAQAGVKVHVVDLTFGERGESEDYWSRTSGTSAAEAKQTRMAEAQEAAEVLGATIEFLDYGDYPLEIGRERLDHLARILRTRRPQTILTHWNYEPYNVDHEVTARAVARAATMAAIPGFEPESPSLFYPVLFAFEPTIPRNDDTGFRPTDFVVIDDVFDLKMQALSHLRSQRKLVRTYTQWAEYRGAQARQWTTEPVRYAEAFYRHTAQVSRALAF
jgi:4-oxalomesaconate hydratase